ncbi:MAG: glycosyltransferase family 4 protein [Proteobacteria bacterium]|nr:glycosyltransferase family 4 protein [Pseudomonadota bacterium]
MDSPQKILMLIGQFYPDIGGAERECQNLSRKLITLGHRATVLTGYKDGLPPFEIVDGIPVYRKIRGWHVFELTYMLSVFLLLWRLRKDFNHIICFGLYLYTAPAVVFALCSGRKIFFRLECSGASGDFCRIAHLKSSRLVSRCAQWAQRIIAISSEIERELLRNGFSQNKIIRIPNSVDTQQFTPVRNAEFPAVPCISFIGRLDGQKGIDILLLALKRLFDNGVPFKAFIVGDGPIKQELVELAEQLLISDVVTFAGPQQDIVPFYHQTSILLLPSRDEGLPLVLLEAMASGLAIIASAVGGVPELLDPGNTARITADDHSVCTNGILIPPENPVALAAAIKYLIENHTVANRLAVNARRHIEEKYSINVVIDKYLQLMR